MKKITTLFGILLLVSCTSNKINEVKETVEEKVKETTTTLSGDFKGSAHPTSGKAEINTEKTELSFTSFKTEQGPVLEVWVASTKNPKTSDEYYSLGALKGLDGNYVYKLPKDVDYTKHKYVLIWCVDFKVLFGYAELK